MSDVTKFSSPLQVSAVTNTAGAAAAAVAQRLGKTTTEGYEIFALDEIVTLTNAVSTNLTNTIPDGAVILAVQANLNSAVTGDGSGDDGLVKVGIGDAGDPDLYGKTSALTQNLKVDSLYTAAPIAVSGAEQIAIYAVDTNGAAVTEKFTAGGMVRVRVLYVALNSLDNT